MSDAYALTTATTPRPASASTPSEGAEKAIRYALAQVGKRYILRAAGPDAYDCSGLTMMAWAQAGVKLPHKAALQRLVGHTVTREELLPGDLIFPYFPITHVAMYVGNGMLIEAENPHDGIPPPHPVYGFAGGACRVSGAVNGDPSLSSFDAGTTASNTGLLGDILGGGGDIFGSLWDDAKPMVFTGLTVLAGLALVGAGVVMTARR